MDDSAGEWIVPADLGIDAVMTRQEFAAILVALHDRHARATQHKLTHKEIADTSGYGVGTINNYLNGRTLPSSERLTDLLTVFDVSADERSALLDARARVEQQHREQRKPSPSAQYH